MSSTRNRVPAHTDDSVNERIRRDTERRMEFYDDNRGQIQHRLKELNEEWNIERAIEANASILALTGLVLGASHDRRWLALPVAVAAFLLQHAVQGWCPPVPILRGLGFRTAYEIEEERRALQALRGDFDYLPQENGRGRAALSVARSA